jgi:hypothetical protein
VAGARGQVAGEVEGGGELRKEEMGGGSAFHPTRILTELYYLTPVDVRSLSPGITRPSPLKRHNFTRRVPSTVETRVRQLSPARFRFNIKRIHNLQEKDEVNS